MWREGLSGEMGKVASGDVLAFGGVKFWLHIFGPTGANIWRALKGIMAVAGAMSLTSSA